MEKTFVCIASGSSLCQEQIDVLGKAKNTENNNIKVIAVNDNWQWKYKEKFISDHLYAADTSWWSMYLSKINKEEFYGYKWVPIKKDFAAKHGINFIECDHTKKGLDGTRKRTQNQKPKINCGNHSGFQAINLAYVLGAKRIILIGYDMGVFKETSKQLHWFGDHPKGLRNTSSRFEVWLRNYEKLADDLSKNSVEVFNCSKRSAIKEFPIVPEKLEDLLSKNS